MIPPGVSFIIGLIRFVMKQKKKQEDRVMSQKVKWIEWLKQSSTIRGIIILAGLVGWGVSPEDVEIFVGAGAAVAYAVYNILRNDSFKRAKDMIFNRE